MAGGEGYRGLREEGHGGERGGGHKEQRGRVGGERGREKQHKIGKAIREEAGGASASDRQGNLGRGEGCISIR